MGGILALDQATKTGWAYAPFSAIKTWPFPLVPTMAMKPYGGIISGVADIGGKGLGVTHKGDKLRALITDLMTVHDVTHLYYETPLPAPAIRNSSTADLLRHLGNVIKDYPYPQGMRAQDVHNQSIKKFFAGTGRADKCAMMGVCERVAPRQLQDDNEADAIAVLIYAAQHIKDQVTERRRNRAILDAQRRA
ncbi:MAG: hypothetical protein AAF607_03880 [Pseudomonadota bacterium]